MFGCLLIIVTIIRMTDGSPDCPPKWCGCRLFRPGTGMTSWVECSFGKHRINDTELMQMNFPTTRYGRLELKHNNLTRFPPEIFIRSSYERISLKDNLISSMPQFSKLVTEIDMSYNRIRGHLNHSVSAWCHRVTKLNLNNNRISGINNATLSNCSALSTLFLTSNQIARIEKETFVNLTSLTRLRLDQNRIQFIAPGAFSQNRYLKQLMLQDNNLTVIPTNVFTPPGVSSVFLMRNNINKIESNSFGFNIRNIFLQSNNLSTIATTWFGDFTRNNAFMDLSHNPLQCTCHLSEVVQQLTPSIRVAGSCNDHTENGIRSLDDLVNIKTCTACLFVTCGNGASCNGTRKAFQCNCAKGFKGRLCETAKTLCDYQPCRNNATCHDVDASNFTCQCLPGHKGRTCEKRCEKEEGKYDCKNAAINSFSLVLPLQSYIIMFMVIKLVY